MTMFCELKVPQLVEDATPSILPNCPSYSSQPSTSVRTSQKKKLEHRENNQLVSAIAQSKQDHAEML